MGLRGEGLVLLIGAVVCLHAALRVQLFAGTVGARCISSSCLSAADEIIANFLFRFTYVRDVKKSDEFVPVFESCGFSQLVKQRRFYPSSSNVDYDISV